MARTFIEELTIQLKSTADLAAFGKLNKSLQDLRNALRAQVQLTEGATGSLKNLGDIGETLGKKRLRRLVLGFEDSKQKLIDFDKQTGTLDSSLDSLTKTFGLTRSEIKRLATDIAGVNSETLIQNAANADVARTLSSSMKLANAYRKALGPVAEKARKLTQETKNLNTFTEDFGTNIKGMSKTLQTVRLGDAFKDVKSRGIPTIQELRKEVDKFRGLTFFRPEALTNIENFQKRMGDIGKIVTKSVPQVRESFKQIGAELSEFGNSIKTALGTSLKSAGQSLQAFGALMKGIVQGITTALKGTDVFKVIQISTSQSITPIINGVKNLRDKLVPAFKILADAFKTLGTGFADSLKSLVGRVKPQIDAFGTSFVQSIKSLPGLIRGEIKSMGSLISEDLSAEVGLMFSNMSGDVVKGTLFIKNTLRKSFNELKGSQGFLIAKDIFIDIAKAFKQNQKIASSIIQNTFGKFKSNISKFIKGTFSEIQKSPSFKFFTQMSQQASATASKAAGQIGNAFKAFSPEVQQTGSVFKQVFGKISGSFESLKPLIGASTGLFKIMGGTINDLSARAAKPFNNAFGAMGKLVTNTNDRIKFMNAEIQGFGGTLKDVTQNSKGFMAFMKRTPGMARGVRGAMNEIAKSGQKVIFSFLGILFFAMNLGKIFGDLARTSVQAFLEIQQSGSATREAMAELSAAFVFLRVAVGEAIFSVIEPMIPKIIEVIRVIANWIAQNQALVGKFVLLVAIGGVFFAFVAQLALFMGSLATLTQFALKVFGSLFGVVAQGSGIFSVLFAIIGAIGLPIILAIIAVVVLLVIAWKTNFGKLQTLTKASFKVLLNTFKALGKSLFAMAKGVFEIIKGLMTGDTELLINGVKRVFRGFLKLLVALVSGLFGIVANLVQGIKNIIVGVFNVILTAIEALFSAAERLPGFFGRAAAAAAKGISKAREAIKGLDDATDFFDADRLEEQRKGVDALIDALIPVKDITRGAVDVTTETGDEPQSFFEKIKEPFVEIKSILATPTEDLGGLTNISGVLGENLGLTSNIELAQLGVNTELATSVGLQSELNAEKEKTLALTKEQKIEEGGGGTSGGGGGLSIEEADSNRGIREISF